MGKLAIVDDQGNVIGEEERSYIHANGLLHKVAHVWFFDDHGNLIVQKRSMESETYPGFYDATVGGHVEIGMGEEETAIKECVEETGKVILPTELVFLGNLKGEKHNNLQHLYSIYAHRHNSGVSTLKGPPDEVEEFITMPLDQLEQNREQFCPGLMEERYLELLTKIPTKPSA